MEIKKVTAHTNLNYLILTPKHYDLDQSREAVEKLLQKHPVFNSLYLLEKEISPLLTNMEEEGLIISNGWFSNGLQQRRNQLAQVSNEINQMIGSAKCSGIDDQKLRRFWVNNSLPVANGFDALSNYKRLHPTYHLMMEYKSHKNYLKMWGEKLRDKGITVPDGVLLQGKWRSFSSLTGRITAKNISLTSMPIAMRDYIVSPKGYQMYSLDLNNAELRFLAYYSKCDGLLEQFNQEMDIHAETAKLISKSLGSHDINKEQTRKLAKQFSYSLLYGAGTQTIVKNMRKIFHSVTSADVVALMDEFYQKYPELLCFLHERGEDEKLLTPFGKIKPIAEFTKTQKKNFAMQASVSVVIKTLLIILARNNIKIVHVIHDEVWVLIPKDEHVEPFIEKSVYEFNEKINEIYPGLPTKAILSKEKIGGEYNE